jgi:hypothetical protein
MSNRILLAVIAVLLAALVYQGSGATAQAQANYEYKVAELYQFVHKETGANVRPQDPNALYLTAQTALDLYTAQGWEFVTATSYGTSDARVGGNLIFKRRK